MAKSLLLECIAALGRVRDIETYIRKDESDARYHGLQQAGTIWINPISPIVETVIHELIHEIRPRWPEGTVAAHTTRLMRRMTDDEIMAVYRLHQEHKIEQTRPVDP